MGPVGPKALAYPVINLHGVRMADGLRKPDPLVFDQNIAENWRIFQENWEVYLHAGLSDKAKKAQAYTLQNLADPEAVEKENTSTRRR